MDKDISKKSANDKGSERANGRAPGGEYQPLPFGPETEMFALHSAIGNQGIGRLLQPDGGKPGMIQAKLTVSQPGDKYEQEADRIADQVLSAPANPKVSVASQHIQRFSGQPAGQPDAVPASVDHALADSGSPLEPALRQEMEHRFSYDFSKVQVRSGATAEQSARDLNADAYTVGQNIVFGAGRFAPGTRDGRRLIAHELTHVVQQQQSGASSLIQRDEITYRSTLENAARPLDVIDSEAERYVKFLHALPLEEARAMISKVTDIQFLNAMSRAIRGFKGTTEETQKNLSDLSFMIMAQIRRVEQGKEALRREKSRHKESIEEMQELYDDPAFFDRYGGGPPPLHGRGYANDVGLVFFPRPVYSRKGTDAFAKIRQGVISGESFFEGLADGISEAKLSDDQKQELIEKTLLSSPLFLAVYAGIMVGITKDVFDTLASLPDIPKAIEAFFELADMMFEPGGEEIARELGMELGRNLKTDITELAGMDPLEFAYELGKRLGPIIASIVLSIMSGGAGAAAKFSKVMAIIGKLRKRKKGGVFDAKRGRQEARKARPDETQVKKGSRKGFIEIPGPTEKQANAISNLQNTLRAGKKWSDLDFKDRALIGTYLGDVTEELSRIIFQGVGKTVKGGRITRELIEELGTNGGRVLLVQGTLRRVGPVDLLEIDFNKGKAVVVDLTSTSRDEHIKKTRRYRDELQKLTEIKVEAMEMRYVGSDGNLLEILQQIPVE